MKLHYRMQQWAQIIQDRAASGETIKAYCEQRGLRRNSYYYWQRILREAASASMQEQIQPDPQPALPPAGWTICEPMREDTPSPTGLQIEVNGCNVRVENDSDMKLLGRVCRMLKSL